jgi:hypothetical protein
MKKISFLAMVAAALTALPASAATTPQHGVVVGMQRGGLELVAGPTGVVRLAHGSARLGSRVDLRAGRVLRVHGLARTARIRGIVVRRQRGETFLSVAGRIVVLHRAGRALASAADTGVSAGDVVSSLVEFSAGGLAERSTDDLGHADGATVVATIAAVGPGSVTLTVNGQSLTIPLPPGVTVPASAVGTQLSLKLDFSGGDPTAEPGDDQGGDHGSPNSGPGSANSGPGSANSGPGHDSAGDGQQAGGDGQQADDDGQQADDDGQQADDDQGDDDGGATTGGDGGGSGGGSGGGDQGGSGGGDHGSGGGDHGGGSGSGSGGDGGGND